MNDDPDDVPLYFTKKQFVDVEGIERKFLNSCNKILKIYYISYDLLLEEERMKLLNILFDGMLDYKLKEDYIFDNLEFDNLRNNGYNKKIIKNFPFFFETYINNEYILEIIINRLEQIFDEKFIFRFIQLIGNYNVFYRFIERHNLLQDIKNVKSHFIIFYLKNRKNDIRFYTFYQKYLLSILDFDIYIKHKFVLSCIDDNFEIYEKYFENFETTEIAMYIITKQIIDLDYNNILENVIFKYKLTGGITSFLYGTSGSSGTKCFLFLMTKFSKQYNKFVQNKLMNNNSCKFIKKIIKKDNSKLLKLLFEQNIPLFDDYVSHKFHFIHFYERKYGKILLNIRILLKKKYPMKELLLKYETKTLIGRHNNYENFKKLIIRSKIYEEYYFVKLYNKYNKYVNILLENPTELFLNFNRTTKFSVLNIINICLITYIVEQYFSQYVNKNKKLCMIIGIENGLNSNELLENQPFGIVSIENLLGSLLYL